VDLMSWQATLSWEDAKTKAVILQKIRAFFFGRGVIEVDTPLLCESTVTDVYLEAFKTSFHFSSDTNINIASDKYLQTSPEYCMKRLLASGYQSIYQLSKAFRHEAKGRYHNPEFTILEWYRLGFSQMDLICEVSDLLKDVLDCDEPNIQTYQDVFIEHVQIDPLNRNIDELHDCIIKANKASDWLLEEDDIDVLLQFIMAEMIEPKIGQSTPFFIYNFPVTQASLAKESHDDPRVAERFECYYKGVELVNGFCELTDANEQEKRFTDDNQKRQSLGLEVKEIDYKFIKALKSGIPACSGVALGVDRLLMLALDKGSIDEVITFTIDRA